MEVDRLKGKPGKGKDQKGKGKDSKGKGKHGKSKGDKGKGDKGKNTGGEVSSAVSEAGASTTVSTVAPSSASALNAQVQQGKGPQQAGQGSVRRVTASPVLFDLSDMEDPFPYEPTVRMISVSTAPEIFLMNFTDDDGDWTEPPDDYCELVLCPEPAAIMCDPRLQPPVFVRAVNHVQHNVIIDSGADVSCIPDCFQDSGSAVRVQWLSEQSA